jgi:hypothetical protein
MTRSILLVGAALISVCSSSPKAEASEAPWCAVITIGEDAVQWDCRYHTFAECPERAGRQSWLLQSEPVLYGQRSRTQALSETPRSPTVADIALACPISGASVPMTV